MVITRCQLGGINKLVMKEVLIVDDAANMLEHQSAEDVIRWAVEHYPNITLACSFGPEDIVLLDMLQKVAPDKDVFYLDTDLHFQETYETKDRLEQKYGIKFIQVLPKLTLAEQAETYGEELWASDPNLCCSLRKVEPLVNILQQYDAWITGIRREQAPTRSSAKKAEYDLKFHLFKFNPLADWTHRQVWSYIRDNDLIYNPLHDQNYPSIGCEKCTRPIQEGEDQRAGRWSNFGKTECGLHK